MNGCLNLTKAGEYAIAALARLALDPGEGSVSVKALADAQKIPASFLAKILSQCAKAGLIRAKTGPDGGVVLGRPAEEISLLAVIEACEGGYQRDSCVFYSSRRCEGPECEVFCPLRKKEEAVRADLGCVTLAEMAEALGRHPYSTDEAVRGGMDGNRG